MDSPENVPLQVGEPERPECTRLDHYFPAGPVALIGGGKPCFCGSMHVHLTRRGLVVEVPEARGFIPLKGELIIDG